MATVSYPGVYVEEVPGGARPIEVASTSTAAFVGITEKGPVDRAQRVTSWKDYETHYGVFVSESYLAESVYQFFNNGGRQCYIVRVAGPDPVNASVIAPNRADPATDGVVFEAANPGAWGNALYVKVEDGTDDPGNTFKVSVFVQAPKQVSEIPSDADVREAEPVEVHDDLGVDPDAPDYFVGRLERDSKYIRGRLDGDNVAESNGYHLGGASPVESIAEELSLWINVDGDGFQEIKMPVAADLAAIQNEIQTRVRDLTRKHTSTAEAAFSGFECSVQTEGEAKRLRLQSGSTGAKSSVRIRSARTKDAASALKLGAAEGGASFDGLSARRPKRVVEGEAGSGVYLLGDDPDNSATPGDDKIAEVAAPTSYETAFRLLDKITDVSLLAAPGVPVFDEGVAYCENRPLRDIFFIGETEQVHDEPHEAIAFRKGITKPNTYGAIFYPWIRSANLSDPLSPPELVPPSGFMAGLFARIDNTRGVWKAPAGTEATVSGATGLQYELNDVEQGNLNKIGVNCLRRFDLAGIVSWGARTIYSDPEYKYVPVRRTAIMLRKSIYEGIQWAVFEPNDHRLWSALRLNIGAFMNGLFRAGAFQGQKASDAYFVRCDLGDTMTQGDIDLGMVIVEVGFAPLKPAEFVIVRIQQKTGQS